MVTDLASPRNKIPEHLIREASLPEYSTAFEREHRHGDFTSHKSLFITHNEHVSVLLAWHKGVDKNPQKWNLHSSCQPRWQLIVRCRDVLRLMRTPCGDLWPVGGYGPVVRKLHLFDLCCICRPYAGEGEALVQSAVKGFGTALCTSR